MLRIRLDINTHNIGTIGVWNTDERRHNSEKGAIEIRYQVHDLNGPLTHEQADHIEDYPHLADVWHNQEGSAATLTEAVMKEVGDEPLISLTDDGKTRSLHTDTEPEAP